MTAGVWVSGENTGAGDLHLEVTGWSWVRSSGETK